MNGSAGSRRGGPAGRGSALPARDAAVHRRSAQAGRALRRLRALRRSRTPRSARSTSREALAAPGVVGVYTAADLTLEPFGTGRPAGRHAGGDAPARAGHATRCASSASRSRSSSPTRARRPSTPPSSSTSTTTPLDVLVDMTKALDDDAPKLFGPRRQPRRRRADRRGRARRRRGARRRALRQPAARRRADGAGRRAGRARPGHAAASSCGRRARARTPTRARSSQVDRASRRTKLRVDLDRHRRRLRRAHRVLPGAGRRSWRWRASSAAPVRYIETRSETMLEMQHGRAQVQDVEIGGTRDGRVTGLKVRVIADCGAYPADAALMPMLTGLMSSRRLRHPEGRLPLRRGRDQHDADRRLPRRRAPGGDGAGRARDRHVRRARSGWTRPRCGAATSSRTSRTRR